MIKAIIVDDEPKAKAVLEEKLRQFCPQVEVVGGALDADRAYQLIVHHKPDLVFLDVTMPGESGFDLLRRFNTVDFEVIFVTGYDNYALDAIRFCAIGYVLKPIQNKELMEAVDNAQKRIEGKNANQRYLYFMQHLLNPGNHQNRIGIPFLEGLEFVSTNEIIRCEGLQKYPRVYLVDGRNLVSSYNLGEFEKLLAAYGFFAPHKSHLVNLSFVKRYTKDGNLVMTDGSSVPVARRRKPDFLEQLKHI